MIKSLYKAKPGQIVKVAAYARISNDKVSQETSLSEQIDYYTRLIVLNPSWEFAGIYYDDGISGTTTTQRKGFTAMIENAKAGLIDIILVKSVSRFARNIIDLLTEVRELRKLGVEIYFESQEMSSLDMKSDMMITMYAEYAEEEAISVSENVKWRVEKNKRDGIYHLPVNQMLGYRYDENGDIYIYEEEAKIIRLIYDMYAKGEGSSNIAKFLTNKKYKNRKGDTMWYANSVRNILRNEKYVGDYLFTKSYVESPLTHKKMLNYGDKEQMLVSNGHPAIVDRDLWDKVQSLMDEKAKHFNVRSHRDDNYDPVKNFTTFTGFIKCPYCGKNYVTKLNHYNGRPSNRHLQCSSNRASKRCSSENYPVDAFEKLIRELIKTLKANKDILKNYLVQGFESKQLETTELDNKINELKKKLYDTKDSLDEYTEGLRNALFEEITKLTREKVAIQNANLTAENQESRIRKILSALDDIDINEPWNDPLFRTIFSKAVIVNKKLIYFIVGNGDMKSYPVRPKMLFKTNISYRVRETYFDTLGGIIINK